MSDRVNNSLLAGRSRLIMASFVAMTALASSRLNAEIVLDEFEVPAIAPKRIVFENNFSESVGVGDLNSTRQIQIDWGGTDPIATFDIDNTSPGRFFAQVQEIRRIDTLTPVTAIRFNYFFDASDVSEGGKNDAMLFDVVDVTGDVQPSWLRAIVRDDTHPLYSYEARLQPLAGNDSPHTLAMPFDEFTIRGGQPGLPDPTTLKIIYFDFYFLGQSGTINWHAQIERIRFGSVTIVPEPMSTALVLAGAVSFGWSRFYWRGVSSHVIPANKNIVPHVHRDRVGGESGR